MDNMLNDPVLKTILSNPYSRVMYVAPTLGIIKNIINSIELTEDIDEILRRDLVIRYKSGAVVSFVVHGDIHAIMGRHFSCIVFTGPVTKDFADLATCRLRSVQPVTMAVIYG